MKNIFKKQYAKISALFFLLSGIITPLKGWSDDSGSHQQDSKIFIAAKAFNKQDCQKYLDRDLLSSGYQPIQIIIKNQSDKKVAFSPDDLNLSTISVEEVISRARTSTVGRAAGYGAAAILVSDLFIIPAIVDGVKSAKANEALVADYHHKTAKQQTIQPNGILNKLIFVSKTHCPSSFKVILSEVGTNRTYEQDVLIMRNP